MCTGPEKGLHNWSDQINPDQIKWPPTYLITIQLNTWAAKNFTFANIPFLSVIVYHRREKIC